MQAANDKKKQQITFLVKIFVALLCIILLVYNISLSNLSSAVSNIKSISLFGILMLSIAVGLLLLLNLAIETLKWHMLTYQFGGNFRSSFKQILGGIAGGIISPNRIGDPFTRSFMLPPSFRIKGLLPATFCSFSQLLATAIFGSVALIHLSSNSLPGIIKLAISQLIIVTLIVLLIWFAMRFFENRIGKLRFSRAIVVVALSLLRYFVFCTELWLIFLYFSPNVNFESMFFATALTFLINSAIPSFSITELGVRAAGASVFFPLFGINSSIAVMATILLWLVNVALPAIPGMMLLIANGIKMSDLQLFRNEALSKSAVTKDEIA